MIFSNGGKRLFLAFLQQTCKGYLYLNINKRKLSKLSWRTVQHFSWRAGKHLSWEPENKSVGEPENISMFSIFYMFSMLPMFSKVIPCSPIRDGRMERFLQPCCSYICGSVCLTSVCLYVCTSNLFLFLSASNNVNYLEGRGRWKKCIRAVSRSFSRRVLRSLRLLQR